jgi:hypothetical protein
MEPKGSLPCSQEYITAVFLKGGPKVVPSGLGYM